jgi:hypothetical protein
MRNQLSDLNNHLFSVLEDLVNPEIDPKTGKEQEVNLDKMKAITDISKQIIDIEKVKVDKVRLLIKGGYRLSENGSLIAPFVADVQKDVKKGLGFLTFELNDGKSK